MELFGSVFGSILGVFGSILGVFGSLIGWIKRDASKDPFLRMKLKGDRTALLVENTGQGKAYNIIVKLKEIGIDESVVDVEAGNERGVGFSQYRDKAISIERKSTYVVECTYKNGLGRKMKASTLQINGDNLRFLCHLK